MRYMDFFGTLGPACCTKDVLREMFDVGMSGVRLNLSHTSLTECEDWIGQLDLACEGRMNKRKLLIDLQGPELRIGILKKPLLLQEGQKVCLADVADASEEDIPVSKQILWELQLENRVLLDDGKLLLSVVEILDHEGATVKDSCPPGGRIVCEVLRGGELTSRKSIAIPGVKIDLPTLTAADIKNLGLAKKYGVTGVMLPFVRSRQDLINLRNTLMQADASHIKIYAKVENLEGVKQLETLLDACDEIVIARGDLGNAIDLTKLPRLQEEIAQVCKNYGRNFMVVTQMLASMEKAEVPTRAEVTDVYHAVKQGASSVMLTAETAVGVNPVKAMKVLVETAKTAL
jgi:pyruvate kinase